MKVVNIAFTILGIGAIGVGLWLIGSRIWSFLPILVGIWWIFEANKKRMLDMFRWLVTYTEERINEDVKGK
jgi:hypothetical protein